MRAMGDDGDLPATWPKTMRAAFDVLDQPRVFRLEVSLPGTSSASVGMPMAERTWFVARDAAL